METWGEEKMELYEELVEIVKLGNPAPKEIEADGNFLTLGGAAFRGYYSSRIWECPWVFRNARLEPGMKILDVGGGSAPFCVWLASKGYETWNIDPRFGKGKLERYLSYLDKQVFKGKYEEAREHLHIFDCGMGAMPFPDNFFDRICSISVSEHLSLGTNRKGVREMYRVLRTNGLILFVNDFKVTRDGGKTYTPILNERGETTNDLFRAILEEAGLPILVRGIFQGGPSICPSLEGYMRKYPENVAYGFEKDFPHLPYGIVLGYPKPFREPPGKIMKMSLRELKKNHNWDVWIEAERKREGNKFTENKLEFLRKTPYKITMVLKKEEGRLRPLDGTHRAYLAERKYGLDKEVEVVVI